MFKLVTLFVVAVNRACTDLAVDMESHVDGADTSLEEEWVGRWGEEEEERRGGEGEREGEREG